MGTKFLSNDWISIARGLVDNTKVVNVFGVNDSLGVTRAIVRVGNNSPYIFPPTANTLTLTSTSANDAAAGTGARTVLVEGLDTNWDEISEIVTLNGLTPVNTVNQYLRVNFMTVIDVGSGEVPAGNLDLRWNSNTQLSYITSGSSNSMNKSLAALYSIPRKKTALLTDVVISTEGAQGTTKASSLLWRHLGGDKAGLSSFVFNLSAQTITLQPPVPLALEQMSDFGFNALGEGGTPSCSVAFQLVLINTPDNTDANNPPFPVVT